MKLPRSLSGREFGVALKRLDYYFDHRESSHMRYCTERDGHFCVTVPDHNPIRAGTLSSLLRKLMEHHNLEREELLRMLFG